jgi:CHAP domain
MDPVGHKLLQIAKSELGYHEKSDGYTKYGDWYGKHVDNGAYYKTAPWCDMFLAWAADKAGVEDWTGEFASTPDHASWFQKHHAWGHQPEPGAIAFFSFSGGRSIGDIEHVGIVEKVHGDRLSTIEANHNDQLARAERDVSQVVGYGYPAKVKVKGKPVPGTEDKYQPKHSAPPPPAHALAGETGTGPERQVAQTSHATPEQPSQLVDQSAMLTGLLAVVVFGTVTLAIARSKVKMPVPSPGVQLRKRGKHHRRPVELPAGITPADLDDADAGTAVMPALTEAAAAQAEDREFWGKISALEEDDELAFWDSLHSVMADAQQPERASTVGS